MDQREQELDRVYPDPLNNEGWDECGARAVNWSPEEQPAAQPALQPEPSSSTVPLLLPADLHNVSLQDIDLSGVDWASLPEPDPDVLEKAIQNLVAKDRDEEMPTVTSSGMLTSSSDLLLSQAAMASPMGNSTPSGQLAASNLLLTSAEVHHTNQAVEASGPEDWNDGRESDDDLTWEYSSSEDEESLHEAGPGADKEWSQEEIDQYVKEEYTQLASRLHRDVFMGYPLTYRRHPLEIASSCLGTSEVIDFAKWMATGTGVPSNDLLPPWRTLLEQ